MTVKFNIIGLPAPQGSKTRMPNGAMVEGSSTSGRARLRDWRSTVAAVAHQQRQLVEVPFDGPVQVTVDFRFPVPKSRPKWYQRLLAKGQHGWKPTKPDLDKLLRALGDGLVQGGLIARDELICSWSAHKIEVAEGDWTGAWVLIEALDVIRT